MNGLTSWLSACLLALAGSTCAAEVIIPDRIKASRIPAVTPDGQKVVGLSLPSTLVVQMPSAEIYVLFGYVTAASPKSVSYSYFVNDNLGVECWVIVDPKIQPDPKGVNTCYQNDQIFIENEVIVPADTYGKMKGTTVTRAAAPGGGTLTAIMRWKFGRKHPSPEPIIAGFK